MKTRKVLTAVLGAACVGCLAAPGVASAGTLDQQQPNGAATGLQIQDHQSVAQTFTAGLTGGLDQVDLKLSGATAGATLPLTVEIRNAAGGSPGGTVLAGGSIPASSAPPSGSPAFVSLAFATPAPVTAGTQYAIVAYGADPSATMNFWSWAYDLSGPYAAGTSFFQATSPPGPTWSDFSPADMTFKTYVATAAPTGKQHAALKKCKKKRSKAKRRKCRKKAKKLPL